MNYFISSTSFIGLEATSNGLKGARINKKEIDLFTINTELNNVNQLYTNHPVIITGITGKELLIRSLHLSLTKQKDIVEALPFQAEPLLPYPSDEALLAYQIISQNTDGTDITLLATRKESVAEHIAFWQALSIEPEKTTAVATALCQFGQRFLPNNKTYFILHLQQSEFTTVLIKENKLSASFTSPEGMQSIFSEDSSLKTWQENPKITEILKKLQQEAAKMTLALAKECKSDEIEGILFTGDGADWIGFKETLTEQLPFSLLSIIENTHPEIPQLLSYAVPVGLALEGSLESKSNINFRQEDLSYPLPWKRLIFPLSLYFTSIFLLTFAFYFFTQQYLYKEENAIKQKYVDLLAAMNKSYDDFEHVFAMKNGGPISNEKIPQITSLTQYDLERRLSFLQKEFQSSLDSFPLFANVPRVSDLLAWLSQHSAVVTTDETGNRLARLQIEDLSYTMIKRPQQTKKQEKYQVKVELEFSTPTPKWAREFHDALIIPNHIVDPKGEVKWSSNRGKYKTSFFLKDKTVYPGS